MTFSKQDFLATSGLQVQTLELWLEQQWIIPEETPAGLSFSDQDIARARLIQDLKGGFGVNDEGIDVVLHLVDQLHGLRHLLRQLHAEMEGASPTGGSGGD